MNARAFGFFCALCSSIFAVSKSEGGLISKLFPIVTNPEVSDEAECKDYQSGHPDSICRTLPKVITNVDSLEKGSKDPIYKDFKKELKDEFLDSRMEHFPQKELLQASPPRSMFIEVYKTYYRFMDNIFNFLENDKGENISENCTAAAKFLRELVQNGDEGAKRFIDATGRPQSNTLNKGASYLGSFSECLSAVVGNQSFTGKYCLAKLSVTNKTDFAEDVIGVSAVRNAKPAIGLCIPSTCTTADVNAAVNDSLPALAEGIAISVECQIKETKQFDVYAKCMIFAIVFFLALSLSNDVLEYIRQTCVNTRAENPGEVPLRIHREGREQGVPEQEPLRERPDGIQRLDSEEMPADEPQPVEHAASPSLWKAILVAFSAENNKAEIFSLESKDGTIECLDGIRLFGMIIILFSHTFFFGARNLFYRNPEDVNNVGGTFLYFFMSWATLAVDVFYLISGLVICYVTYKKVEAESMNVQKFPSFLLTFIVRRYFRLTPLLMTIIAYSATMLHYAGAGPDYMNSIAMYNSWCRTNWWRNLLHIQNYGYTENMCFGPSWYIATDMQFSLMAPFVIFGLYKLPRTTLFSVVTACIGSMVLTGVITERKNFPAIPYYIGSDVPPEIMNMYYKEVYMMPHTRVAPYFIGMLLGYILIKKPTMNIKKEYQVFAWVVPVAAIVIVLGDLFYVTKTAISTNHAAMFSALFRPVFALGLGIVILGCHYKFAGLGGFNSSMSWKYFKPWSRMTYAAYLMHPIIMDQTYGSFETAVHYSTGFLMLLFHAFLAMTYTLTPLLVIYVEYPFKNLGDLLVKRISKQMCNTVQS